MFVGHYGPAAALGGHKLRLWHGFLAVQFLDLIWAPAVLLGVESVRIIEGFTASNHFDLFHMPYSHSLPMAIVWSVFAGFASFLLVRERSIRFGAIMAMLVFSHWIFDFITHKPDLPLWFGGPKVGLGLWENRPVSFGLELGLFGLGLGLFAAKSFSKSIWGKVSLGMLVLVGILMQVIGNWGPPPATPQEAAVSALVAYAVFVTFAAWVDATRSLKSQ